jgi:broad specificity phosphatase PhoE
MAFWITTIIGIIGFVITVMAFLFPDLGRKIVLLFMPGPRFNWANIPKEIAHAKRKVYVLQTWLPTLRGAEATFWKQALSHEDIEFRVLLLDQKLVPFRLRCRDKISSNLPQNISDLALLAQSFNRPNHKKLQLRFYSCLPFGPIFMIDDDIYWGIYLSDRDSLEGPSFHSKSNSTLGRFILSSYESIWKSASDRINGFSINPYIAESHSKEEPEIQRTISRLKGNYSNVPFEQLDPDVGCLLLLRHADTDLNQAGIITGDLDIGINSQGRERARQISRQLRSIHWERVISSPLRRCMETLIEAFNGKIENIELCDELRERAMGEVEGYYKNTYETSLPSYSGVNLLNSFHAVPAGGESYCSVFWRVISLLEESLSLVRNGQHILFCAHEAPIRVIIMALEGLNEQEVLSKEIMNCATYLFVQPHVVSNLPPH